MRILQIYQNTNGNSNVSAFEIGTNYIDVKFNGTAKIYRYSYEIAGAENVEVMKALAKQGYGLNSFIMRNVRTLYDR